MNCPNCNQSVPESNYKCPHCGKVLKTGIEPGDFLPPPITKQKATPNSTVIVLIIIVIGIAVLGFVIFQHNQKKQNKTARTGSALPAGTSEMSAGTAGTPGEKVNIKELLCHGQITIFDFYSVYCQPCIAISPMLETLDNKRKDIVVVKININREGVTGIDWNSPVIQQYEIHSIPYFIIFNAAGERTHVGREAGDEVYRLLKAEGIIQ